MAIFNIILKILNDRIYTIKIGKLRNVIAGYGGTGLVFNDFRDGRLNNRLYYPYTNRNFSSVTRNWSLSLFIHFHYFKLIKTRN